MRFRSLFHLPSLSGYLGGFSVWRAIAYGTASDMGRMLSRPKEMRRANERVLYQMACKQALREAGILPYPGEKKIFAAPRRAAYVATATRSIATQTYITPTKPTTAKRKPVLGAAVKSNGGLRGSTATRWHR